MESLNVNEVKAMISLLDDTDPEIFNHIRGRLVAFGRDVIPVLEDAWSGAFNPLLQERIENIVHKIQFESLKSDLAKWAAGSSNDLLTGSLLIAHYQYPDLDEEKVRAQLNKIRKDLWLELNDQMTPQEQVLVINKVLFEVHNFTGNTANFHAPQNSFINTVLETKKGNPLLLSIIYSILAQQLDIPIYGVNLPEHFILAYQDNRGNTDVEYTYPEAGILFYINAFSKGTIFGKSDIDEFLKKLDMRYNKIFYEPCSNVDMIRRILRNLSFSFQKLGQTDKVEETEELLECLNPKKLSSPESEE
ncbi:MAG: transglutaminase family protein [Bacteroidia bacterium]|nr:transglutaminase family protein [Bacteroidota bacterium]MBK9425626.1 transglutaminase family protein [Bacteroidota bacterium]MBL0071345.1 transglutaminase family protein [Bacteroidota bacterium]MBP9081895.1 transglutaminase family protein [Bacteroidia bacterium]